jgi:carbohydrate diacid regulator
MHDERLLSVEACTKVVAMVHEATGLIVNIMGDGGRILASSMPERIGSIHEGASRIMAGTVEEIAIDEMMATTMKGVRPGFTGAVRLNGRLVGCIGIGGNPESVKPLQKLAVLALKQEIEQAHTSEREKRLVSEIRHDIGDIAERMQILSLNGAVLAARLGASGHGFKIVVAEMRVLAAQIGEKLVELAQREKATKL